MSLDCREKDTEFSDYLTRYFSGKTVKQISSAKNSEGTCRVSMLFENDQEIEFRIDVRRDGTPPLISDGKCHHVLGMSWR